MKIGVDSMGEGCYCLIVSRDWPAGKAEGRMSYIIENINQMVMLVMYDLLTRPMLSQLHPSF